MERRPDWTPEVCIFHSNCQDGFASAWVIQKRFGREVDFIPGTHGQPIDIDRITGKRVVFVDFSVKHDAMLELARRAGSIVILDHHATAKNDLLPFTTLPAGIYGTDPLVTFREGLPTLLHDKRDNGAAPVAAFFDMERSGARLAWDFCFPGETAPELIVHVEDRDLWRFHHRDKTRRFCAALGSYEQAFDVWDNIDYLSLYEEGRVILRIQKQHVAELCRNVRTDVIEGPDGIGYPVPSVNAPGFYSSDTGDRLLKMFPDAPFVATWYTRENGSKRYSLRSEAHRVDVSKVASFNGGGGHRNSAGFQVDRDA